MRMAKVLALVALLGAPALAAAADVPDDLEASWAATTTSRADLDASIERVVTQMSAIKRPFARSKLKQSLVPCRQLKIWETPDHQVGIQCDGTKAAVAPADGRSVSWKTSEGDRFTLTHRVEGDRIIQTFKGDKGTKRTVYAVSGGRLRVDVTVESRHLPTSIHWGQSFAS